MAARDHYGPAVFVGALRARREASSPRPLLDTCACAFALGAALIGVWAVWQGGVPEFSDTGLI